jgi:hypothetical protein
MRNVSGRFMADERQASFLAMLPGIERYGRVCFRDYKCGDRRNEAVAEMVALAWKWYVRLLERGKDPLPLAPALAVFAALAVKSGRRLVGQTPAQEALSPWAQARHGFAVRGLPRAATLAGWPCAEALRDNTRTPVPDQVSFRLDFPAWLASRTERDRRLIEDLMLGGRAKDVARKYGLSPSRVSQLRRGFLEDWQRFAEAGSTCG